jgi:predicted DCC family thiol-disulfide oxidoreductase YuxK
LCIRWVERIRTPLERHGFTFLPLQSAGVRESLGLPERDLLKEMRVITREGSIYGGADALVYLSQFIFKPLFWLGHLPGAKPLLRFAYNFLATHRTCDANGCRAEAVNIPPSSFAIRHFNFGVGNPVDWLPLLMFTLTAAVVGRHFPAWLYMWTLAFALFAGCKWLCLRLELAKMGSAAAPAPVRCDPRRKSEAWDVIKCTTDFTHSGEPRGRVSLRPGRARSPLPIAAIPLARKIGFLFAWVGMDAATLLKKKDVVEIPRAGEWIFGGIKTLLGGALLWGVARYTVRVNPLLGGWTGMVGIILLLHFGLFHLLALGWRAAGFNAQPLMRAPLLSRSVGEFWGHRWNTAFNRLATQFVFLPWRRTLGLRTATMLVFLVSGLVHDLLLSIPARGGYGLPTLYFLLQGAGVLFEHTKFARRCGLNGGIRGRIFMLTLTAGPVFWLFHPIFVDHVILPFLKTIGAT